MPRKAMSLVVSEADKETLQSIIRAKNSAQKLVMRAKIILLAGEGIPLLQIARQLDITRQTVDLWRNRYNKLGIDGIDDLPGKGRKPYLPPEKVKKVIVEAIRPPDGQTRWSCRTMAKHVGISKSAVQTIWSANDIKPHRMRTFKISKDPHFEEKFWDVIALYLNPPDKALVLCCDEKSQCQALERTQPGLPLGVGHIKTKTHDYYRHGTLTLFAALNYMDGKLIHRTEAQHTHIEWLKFLKQIHRETPKGLELHLIVDNSSTHKKAEVREWIEQHERFHVHFTPTSSSWMNLVERFFRDITQEAIREGSFRSIHQLSNAIIHNISIRNDNPKRYVWKADGKKILEKIERARKKMLEEL